MNKTLKRTLAIALTLVMLTAMVPMMASGAVIALNGITIDAPTVAPRQFEQILSIANRSTTGATPISATPTQPGVTLTGATGSSVVGASWSGSGSFGSGTATLNVTITLTDDTFAVGALTPTVNGVGVANIVATRVSDTVATVTFTVPITGASPTSNPINADRIGQLAIGGAFVGIARADMPQFDTPIKSANNYDIIFPEIAPGPDFGVRLEGSGWQGAGTTPSGRFGNSGLDITYTYLLLPIMNGDIPVTSFSDTQANNDAIAARIKTALDAGAFPTKSVGAQKLVTGELRVIITYTVQKQIIPSMSVTSDINRTPNIGDRPSMITLPTLATQSSIKNVRGNWGVSTFQVPNATLTLTIEPADHYTFDYAPFLNANRNGFSGDAGTAIRNSFNLASNVVPSVDGAGNLILTISYPASTSSPANASALVALLVDPAAMRIPIRTSMGITPSTTNDSIGFSAGQNITIGAGLKTLVLENNAVVTLDRNLLGGTGGIAVTGEGTLVIPAGRSVGSPTNITVSGGATFSTNGWQTFGVPITIGNNGTLAANGVEFGALITVPTNASATINGDLTVGTGGLTVTAATAWPNTSGKLSVNGALTLEGPLNVQNNADRGRAEMTVTSITRNTLDAGATITVNGLLKATNLNLGGQANVNIGTAALKGILVVSNSFVVDQSAIGNGIGSGIIINSAHGTASERSLLLAGTVSGSGAGSLETLQFRGNNPAVDNRNVFMVKNKDINAGFFNVDSMDPSVFFNTSETNGIARWTRDAAGTQAIPGGTSAAFPGGFGPLYAQWVYTAPSIPVPTTPAELVKGFYEFMLGRGSDTDGLDYWTDEITSGRLPGRQLGVAFVTSPEFLGRNLSASDFVEALYNGILGRPSEPLGKAYWVGELAVQTRAAVARNFANAGEFKALLVKLEIDW